MAEIREIQGTFQNEMLAGFSEAEREQFEEFNRRIGENIRRALERREII